MKDCKNLEDISGKKHLVNIQRSESVSLDSIESQDDKYADRAYCEQVKKDFENRQKNKIKANSRKMVELLENISDPEYEDITNPDCRNPIKLIHDNNLKRVIRVRNIIKHRDDLQDDSFGMKNMNRFKDTKRKFDSEVAKTLSNLGPPSFLKTKFKNSTIESYKIAHGKYFGCSV